MGEVDLTVARTLSLALTRGAERPAVYFGTQTLSHADLQALSNQVANQLLAHGLERGDRVAIVLPNCPEYIAIAIGCAKAAVAMVTLNYRFTASEFIEQIRNSGASLLIYSDHFRDAVGEVACELPAVQRICVGEPGPGDVGELSSLLAEASSLPPSIEVNGDNLFYLGYTSGTTGLPKGAMVTQRNRALAYHFWALEYGVRDNDVVLHTGPFHHTAPFTFVLMQLFMGGAVVILDHFDPELVAQSIEKHRGTWGFFVPFMLDRLIASAKEVGASDLSSLRFIISGASPLPTSTKEGLLGLLPQVGLHEFYGATEAGVIANLRPADQRRKTRCVGRPVFDTEIEIRDEDNNPVPTNTVGNIWMCGPTVFSGYYQAPEKNQEVFSGDWCTLGDVGRIDDEGYLYILDRRKDVIKSGGVNIFPMEIEEVLRAETGIADASVVGVPDDVWGEAAHAVIVYTNGVSVRPEELTAACRLKLAGFKVPKSFEMREELPRNANGKVLKRVLRQEFIDRNQMSEIL